MSELEISEAMTVLALASLSRLAKEIWHRASLCSCFLAFNDRPCEIGLEKINEAKAAKLFAEWDALGLGYIGPRLCIENTYKEIA